VARREDLTATNRRKKNREGTARDPWLVPEIAARIEVQRAHLKALEPSSLP
jgi:hypothetical protein